MIGVAESAFETEQFFFAVSASSWNFGEGTESFVRADEEQQLLTIVFAIASELGRDLVSRSEGLRTQARELDLDFGRQIIAEVLEEAQPSARSLSSSTLSAYRGYQRPRNEKPPWPPPPLL